MNRCNINDHDEIVLRVISCIMAHFEHPFRKQFATRIRVQSRDFAPLTLCFLISPSSLAWVTC